MDFEAIFRAVDTDSSGEIDMQELNNYMKQQNLPEHFVQRWQDIFSMDSNGTISLEKYRSVFGLQPRRDYLAMFKKADAEGKQTVDAKTLKEVFVQEKAADVYDMYFKDQPEDAQITEAEFRAKMKLQD